MNTLKDATKEAVLLAKKWQERANELLSPQEKAFQNQMMRLLSNSKDKVVLAKMIDQSFRSKKTDRVADQIVSLLIAFGIPTFFSKTERILTRIFILLGRYFSIISIPIMIKIIRLQSSRVVFPGEKKPLLSQLKRRKKDGVRMNINHLGEAVLGEDEALSRLNTYLEDLKDPEVEYISVKISTIYSQILPLAFDHTVSVLKDRLSILYRAAKDNLYTRKDGTKVPKFVNLDMEEHQDLVITSTAFTQTLDEKEFKNYSAGIVLQSYIPESYEMQQNLTKWAKKRESEGGGPIKIRIVKGANLEMEKVESSIRNWPLATYDNKLEVDANYKRMVEYGMRHENIGAVHLGIASHNLFELAFAFKLAEARGVGNCFTFEMLEGMADHVRRAIQETSGDMILYAPVALKDQFINAIAYLIRRLDENTAKENFLRYASDLTTDSPQWSFLEKQFLDSCKYLEKAGKRSKRFQNRTTENCENKNGTFHQEKFANEPDTDWSLTANRKWAEAIKEKWENAAVDSPIKAPVVVAGTEIYEDRRVMELTDPSKPDAKEKDTKKEDKICVSCCAMANDEDILNAVKTAKEDKDNWRGKSLKERHKILSKVAIELMRARGDLIGSAALATGKIFTEADVEVSEAIDFAKYYPYSLKAFEDQENIRCTPKGVGLVISPWNFPIAIPCGGITAALAAGNTVIFKPASAAVLPAWQLCQCFWRAGVSRNVLQFLPLSGGDAGEKLVKHDDVDFIIFTGGTDTALQILSIRPDIYFAGETGGKNATIVTSMSDRDQAIKNVVHSAFSNCGQKCSATSLLILEEEVYNDPSFKKQLKDAAQSYKTGSAWEFENKMGPLILPPEGKLKKALTSLEQGETWLVKPENTNDNPSMWTPGIKWDVKPKSETHMVEFFGPLLGVMCAKDLGHAIELANHTGYGLTSGLESLDNREQDFWKSRIKAGNLYINKGTTGAVVLRQPFGGMGKSALGAGIKAGGPNYVIQFTDVKDKGLPGQDAVKNDHPFLLLCKKIEHEIKSENQKEFEEDLGKTISAVKSYIAANQNEFSKETDYFHLRGQDNIVRYLPKGTVVVRIHDKDSLFEILARIAAVKVAGSRLIISIPPDMKSSPSQLLFKGDGKKFFKDEEILSQSDNELAAMIPQIDMIRYAAKSRVPDEVFKNAALKGFYISSTKVVMEGSVELLQYYREQSICNSYHRYGNLGERSKK